RASDMGLTVPAPSLSPTPSSRMHSANFTAFWWVAAALLLPLLPVPAGALEQPPTITASMGRRAAAGGVFSYTFPRACVVALTTGSLPSVLVTAASLDRFWGRRKGRAAVIDGFGAQFVVAGFVAV